MSDDIITALVNSLNLVVPEAILGLAACVLFVGCTFIANRHVWAGVTRSRIG